MSVEGTTYALRPAVPRARHRQPDRVRGHLPAARGAARPVPAARVVRLPDSRTRSGTCCAAGWPAAARRPSSSRSSTPTTCSACRRRWRTSRSRTRSAATSSRSTAATREHPQVLVGASPRGSLALHAAVPGRGPRSPAATTWCPRTSSRSPCPRSRTGITLRPEMWLRRVDPALGRRRGARADAGAGQRRAAHLRRGQAVGP